MRQLFVFACIIYAAVGQSTYLVADGNSLGTYSLLNRVLGGTAYEVPDCGHPIQHITQQLDPGISCSEILLFFAFQKFSLRFCFAYCG